MCAGAGIVVFDINDSILLNKGIKLDHRVSIYTCEIIAIDHVITWLNRKDKSLYKNSNITIFTDSLSSVQSLKSGKSRTRPEILHNIIKSIKSLQNKNLQVSFGWISSHVGIIGNEIADQTAKTGSKSGEILNIKLSIKEMYHIVEQKVKQTFKGNILNPLQLKFQYFSNPTSLTVYSNIIQLDTVHTKLSIQLSRLGGETPKIKMCTLWAFRDV